MGAMRCDATVPTYLTQCLCPTLASRPSAVVRCATNNGGKGLEEKTLFVQSGESIETRPRFLS